MRYQELHSQAQINGEPGYIDPDSGLFVMTERTLRKRGRCCGNGCRHCPFGRSLAGSKIDEQNQILVPDGLDAIPENAVFLFWSGGKDSYLAFLELQKEHSNIVLCTTFANEMVGHQEIPVGVIREQARHLGVPLVLIALKSNQRYEERVLEAVRPLQPRALAFGDLHLEGIRAWREKYFLDMELLFPIWKIEYPVLLKRLMEAEGTAFISALGDNFPAGFSAQVGDEYTETLAKDFEQLGIDQFGENGEFHTEVRFRSS